MAPDVHRGGPSFGALLSEHLSEQGTLPQVIGVPAPQKIPQHIGLRDVPLTGDLCYCGRQDWIQNQGSCLARRCLFNCHPNSPWFLMVARWYQTVDTNVNHSEPMWYKVVMWNEQELQRRSRGKGPWVCAYRK
jgi:hypothetical protein